MFLKNLTLQEASEIAAQIKRAKNNGISWCILQKIQTSIDRFSLFKA